MGKDYQVTCPEGQQHQLMDAAYYLDQSMANIRQSGRVIGLERIAVMAALNLANDFLKQQSQNKASKAELERRLGFLQEKIEKALTRNKVQTKESVRATDSELANS